MLTIERRMTHLQTAATARRHYPSSSSGWSGRVVTVRSEAAINLPAWANVIVILMTVRLDATLGHAAARANVILTLPFRVDPHTSSDRHLFRAMPNDFHVCLWTIGIR